MHVRAISVGATKEGVSLANLLYRHDTLGSSMMGWVPWSEPLKQSAHTCTRGGGCGFFNILVHAEMMAVPFSAENQHVHTVAITY